VKNTKVVVSCGCMNTRGVIHILVERIGEVTFQSFPSNSVDHQLPLQYPVY
jgi:hypothetical protein